MSLQRSGCSSCDRHKTVWWPVELCHGGWEGKKRAWERLWSQLVFSTWSCSEQQCCWAAATEGLLFHCLVSVVCVCVSWVWLGQGRGSWEGTQPGWLTQTSQRVFSTMWCRVWGNLCLGAGWALVSRQWTIALCILHFVYEFIFVIVSVQLLTLLNFLSKSMTFTFFFFFFLVLLPIPLAWSGGRERMAEWCLIAVWERCARNRMLGSEIHVNWGGCFGWGVIGK